MDKEKRIYTEVYLTLVKYNSEDLDKIPQEVKKEIFEKADTTYLYRIDSLLPESQEIIASIVEKYINKKE